MNVKTFRSEESIKISFMDAFSTDQKSRLKSKHLRCFLLNYFLNTSQWFFTISKTRNKDGTIYLNFALCFVRTS